MGLSAVKFVGAIGFLIFIGGCVGSPPPPHDTHGDTSSLAEGGGADGRVFYGCGKPLIDAAQSRGIQVRHDRPQFSFETISRRNLDLLVKEVGDLSATERVLFNFSAQMMPPGYTHRTTLTTEEVRTGNSGESVTVRTEVLRMILEGGFLDSPEKRKRVAESSGRGSSSSIKPKVTPPQENLLYGAFSCVFAAVGPLNGREQYGDVIFRFKQPDSLPREQVSFATYSSAFSFMRQSRTRTCESQCRCVVQSNSAGCEEASKKQAREVFDFKTELDQGKLSLENQCSALCGERVLGSMKEFQPGLEERWAYAETVVAPIDYQKWFRYTMIKLLRKHRQKDSLTKELLQLSSRPVTLETKAQWWNTIDTNWLGYLEAKYDGGVAMTDLESIDVPPSQYREVLGWNLRPEVRAKIRSL